MKKLLILLTLILISVPAQAIIIEQMEIYPGGMYAKHSVAPNVGDLKAGEFPVTQVDREKGYYVDGRNQFPEHQHILPPNPEMIPKNPHPTRTVEPFESYYDRNIKGLRRQPYMTPVIPNYNRFYSERRATPYTRKEYMDVWCTGEKNYKKGYCSSENYQIYFVKASEWAWGVTKLPFQIRSAKKLGKSPALFLCVDELAGDAPHMHDAKDFAELFNIQLFFGTIDSYIPLSWIV